MERREFLKAVSAFTLAGISGTYNLNSPNMKIQLGCFNRPWNRFPIEQTLEGIKGAGYSGAGLFRSIGSLEITTENAEENCQILNNH